MPSEVDVASTPAPRQQANDMGTILFSMVVASGVAGIAIGVFASSIYFLTVADNDTSAFPPSSSSAAYPHPSSSPPSQNNAPSWSVCQELRLISLEAAGLVWPDCNAEAYSLDVGEMSLETYNSSYCAAHGWLILLSSCGVFWLAAWHGGTLIGNCLFDGIRPAGMAAGDAASYFVERAPARPFGTNVRQPDLDDLLSNAGKVHSKSRKRRETILPPLMTEAPRPPVGGLFSEDDDDGGGQLSCVGGKRLSPLLRAVERHGGASSSKNQPSGAAVGNLDAAFAAVPLPCEMYGTPGNLPIVVIAGLGNGGFAAADDQNFIVHPLVEGGCSVVLVDASTLRGTKSIRGSRRAASKASTALVDAVLALQHAAVAAEI